MADFEELQRRITQLEERVKKLESDKKPEEDVKEDERKEGQGPATGDMVHPPE